MEEEKQARRVDKEAARAEKTREPRRLLKAEEAERQRVARWRVEEQRVEVHAAALSAPPLASHSLRGGTAHLGRPF